MSYGDKLKTRFNPSRRLAVLYLAASLVMAGMHEQAEAFLFTGGKSSSVPPPSFSVPLTLNNISTASSFTTPMLSYNHPFKDGDIPVGGRVELTDSLGNNVIPQMDQVSYWPSGCVRMACLTHNTAETFAASSSKNYTVINSASAPNNTPNSLVWGGTSDAAIAAAFAANGDVKAVYYGGDAGASTYTVSLNYIVANYFKWPWGTSSPRGGWRVVKKGPVACEIHVWEYIKNDSTLNAHGYVRCDMWVKAAGPAGPYTIDIRTHSPNIWNTINATSEKFGQKQGRFTSALDIKNGATVIATLGGAGDPRSTTIANVNFNTATCTITAANVSLVPQTACTFSSTGTLPAGLTAGTIYWLGYPSGGTGANPQIFTEQIWAVQAEGSGFATWLPSHAYILGQEVKNGAVCYTCTAAGTSAASGGPTGTGTVIDGGVTWLSISVPFTTQGTGTITVSPLYSVFPNQNWFAADTRGDPFVSSGSHPQIFPGHDFQYLTQETKFTPPYRQTIDQSVPSTAVPTYQPNQNYGGIQWAQNATGDGAGDQRIGYIDNWGLVTLYQPAREYYIRASLQSGLCFGNMVATTFNDETGGNNFVGNNGPANNGVGYPNFPSLIPAWNGNNTAGSNPSAIVARGAAWSGWSTLARDLGGFTGQYYATVNGSHLPAPWQIPYLKTGRSVFLELGISNANSQVVQTYLGKQTISGTTYYCLLNGTSGACQTRAWAWGLRSLNQCMYMIPADHPFQPVITTYYNNNAAFQATYYVSGIPTPAKTLGMWNSGDRGYSGQHPLDFYGHDVPWQDYFVYMAVAMEAWRGGLTDATAGANWTAVMSFKDAYWNIFATNRPASLFYSSFYDFTQSDRGQGNGGNDNLWFAGMYQTPDECFNATFALSGCNVIASVNGTTMTVTGMRGGKFSGQGSISGNVLTITSVDPGSMRLDVGDYVVDGNLNNVGIKTKVTALLTGVGGIGTYQLSATLGTVATQAIYSCVVLPGTGYVCSGTGFTNTASTGVKINSQSTGTTGWIGNYVLNLNLGTLGSATVACGGQNTPYPTRVAVGLYDQNAVTNFYKFAKAFPGNCNWYGNIFRMALAIGKKAQPGNTLISDILDDMNTQIAAITGLPAAQGGVQWSGTTGGVTGNFPTFSCY